MNRTTLYAAVAAAAIVVAGCGSTTAGAPEAGTTTAAAILTSSAPTTTPSSDTVASSPAPAPASETGSPTTGATDTEADTETAANTQTDTDTGESSEAPTVTLGNGTLDSTSAAWFDAFCTGMAPLAAFDATPPSGTDPKAELTSAVASFKSLGDAFTNTAKALAPLPPPTFPKGDELAHKIVQVMGQAGPAVTAAAHQLATVKATDQAAVSQAIMAATQTMGTAIAGMGDISNYELDPKTDAAVAAIPSCKKISFSTGG